MENEPLGTVLQRILFSYVQQWAERSGFTLLSRLLVDEQFQVFVEKYADEMVILMASSAPGNGNGWGSGKRSVPRAKPHVSETDADANDLASGERSVPRAKPHVSETDADADDLASLHDRVLALEAQQEMQQALFEALRIKIQ